MNILKSLAISEKSLLNSLLPSLEYGLTIQDRDYNILYQNDFMRMHFGSSSGKCYEVYEFRKKPCKGCPVREAFRDEKPHESERSVPEPTGELRAWLNTAVPIRNDEGKVVACLEIVRDIGPRKRLKKTLEESEARLASLSDNIPGGMTYQVELDSDGKTRRFTYVSAGVEKMHEVSADAVLKDAGLLYEQIAEDQRSLFMAKENEALKEMKNFSVEACFQLPSGRTRWGMLSSAPRLSPNGNIIWDGIEIDITNRKKAEKDREQLQEQLLKSQRMESIGTLAGGIAHQFNNALAVVTGNIELLEMNPPEDKEIAHYVKEIKTSANRMVKLTAQLLTYARGGKYQAKKISLSDFVRDTLPLIGYAENPAIHIDTYFADDIFDIEVDPTQLQMVLTAILLNASEAMDGKGCIRIDCRNEIITEQFAERFPGFRSGSYACMTITDDGKGMDEETKNRVFEPFFTTKFKGRGLGMATAYGFAKNHDGYIIVDSELGKGTTVKIHLPAYESPGEEEAMQDRIE